MSPTSARPGGAGRGGTLPFSLPVIIAVVAAEVLFLLLAFALKDPVIPLGVFLTVVWGALILADPRMAGGAVAFVTFAVHSEIVGEMFIVKVLGVNFYAMDWVMAFAALSLLHRLAAGGALAVKGSGLTAPLVLFLLSLPVFAAVGLANGYPFQNAAADMRLFFYYASYFLVLAVCSGEEDLRFLFWTVIVFGMVGTLPQLYSSVTSMEVDRLTGRLLAFGRIRGANEVNYPMLLAASVVAYPYMRSYPARLLLGTSAVVSALALFLTYTRGSWLAGGLGILATLVIYGRSGEERMRALKIAGAGLLLFVLTFSILDLTGIFTYGDLAGRLQLVTLQRIDISSLQRVTEWVSAWNVFTENPVLGAGLGYTYEFWAIGVGQMKQVFLHNSYLYVLSKMGVAGMALFLWLFLKAISVSRRTLRLMPPSPAAGYLLGFCAMLIVLMVKSLTTWHLNTLTTSLFVGLLLGVTGGAEIMVRRRDRAGHPETG